MPRPHVVLICAAFAGAGQLRVGKRVEDFRARELGDDEKIPVLRAYLRKWKVEVGLGYATPLVVGNRIFMFTRQGDDEVMSALDPESD